MHRHNSPLTRGTKLPTQKLGRTQYFSEIQSRESKTAHSYMYVYEPPRHGDHISRVRRSEIRKLPELQYTKLLIVQQRNALFEIIFHLPSRSSCSFLYFVSINIVGQLFARQTSQVQLRERFNRPTAGKAIPTKQRQLSHQTILDLIFFEANDRRQNVHGAKEYRIQEPTFSPLGRQHKQGRH